MKRKEGGRIKGFNNIIMNINTYNDTALSCSSSTNQWKMLVSLGTTNRNERKETREKTTQSQGDKIR